MKVVMLDGATLVGHDYRAEARIFAENGIEFVESDCRTEEDIIKTCQDADGIMTVYGKLNATVIRSLKRCKVFVRYGVGYDVIDVEAATKAGIAVCNLPDYCVEDVALHTAALVLNALRKITIYDRSVRRGEWNNGCGYPVHRPGALTLGFLGFGNIARCAARYLAPTGFSMIGYDPYLPPERFEALDVQKVSFEILMRNSDIISVHAPLTKETQHIIDKNSLALAKDGVILVNTSRGGLICFDDLVAALDSGKVLSANLDVVEREPLSGNDCRILEHENVTITPHSSFNSIEATLEMHTKAAVSACAVLKGDLPENTVNLKQLKEFAPV